MSSNFSIASSELVTKQRENRVTHKMKFHAVILTQCVVIAVSVIMMMNIVDVLVK